MLRGVFFSFIAMTATVTVPSASVIGIAPTGFYPEIIVLLILPKIPIASNFYSKKISSKSNAVQRSNLDRYR